ncbi:MAG: response regulator [bacterium]|nr:response regulator [bacterium]
MSEDIRGFSSGNIRAVTDINKALMEKALHMRCISYLSHVKEQLLVETIFELDRGKKDVIKMAHDIELQRNSINEHKKELEQKNRQLEQMKLDLEERVKERTAELEKVNRELLKEIDEREQAEKENQKYRAQLLQAQKMESIGRLAGGVAHDFNNLLTAILGYSQLALYKLPENSPLTMELGNIMDAGEKAAALTKQLLAFSRKQVLQMKVVNLNRVVRNMTKILRRMLGEDLVMDIHCEESLVNIIADVPQLEQILLNLAVNARDAMPGGGRLHIETANITIKEPYWNFAQSIKPGPYVMLAVTDTGKGMPPEVQENIFDPFFTTKEVGKGTGLGLATVHGVVKQHNGYIFVYSEVDNGTTFKIYLPATSRGIEVAHDKVMADMPPGTECILVVDDKSAIRRLVADTLQPLGYTILTASGGKNALEIFNTHPGDIHLVITDMIMPGMKGSVLKKKLLAHATPPQGIIAMSGYSEGILPGDTDGTPGMNFLPKPFSPSQLAHKVREVLDGEH